MAWVWNGVAWRGGRVVLGLAWGLFEGGGRAGGMNRLGWDGISGSRVSKSGIFGSFIAFMTIHEPRILRVPC